MAKGSAPEQLGPYRLTRELARGGMGAVYEAVHEETGARVALKTILPGLAELLDRERFTKEAQLSARLDHPHIVPIHTAVLEPPTPYLVQDLLPGPSLKARVGHEGPLPVEEAVEVAVKLAGALQHAHEQGVLHRDLKPSNVLFDERGQPRLVDFGVALGLDEARERLTRTGELVGTPAYMAPEQALGSKQVDARTDVYGLGAVLYFMLVGEAPFAGAGLVQTLQMVAVRPARAPAAVRPEVPPEVSAACLRALAKKPEERYASATDFARALREREHPRSTRAGLWVAVALLVLGLATGLWRWRVSADRAPRVQALESQLRDALHSERSVLELEGMLTEMRVELDRLDANDAKAALRLRVLEGLLALARGDAESAQASLNALDPAARSEPPGCALRGALAAEQGDAQTAHQDLTRALRRVRRSELRGWRARARVRLGLREGSHAREVLADLRALGETRELSRAQALDRARAHLTLGQLREAGRVLGALDTPPAALRKELLLARVERSLRSDAAAALAVAEQLDRRGTVDARRRSLARSALANVGKLSPQRNPLGVLTHLQLVRALDPEFDVMSAAVRPLVLGLLEAGATRAADTTGVDFLLAVADLAPNNLRIQLRVAVHHRRIDDSALRVRLRPCWQRVYRLRHKGSEPQGLVGRYVKYLWGVRLLAPLIAVTDDALPGLTNKFIRGEVLFDRGTALANLSRHVEAHAAFDEVLVLIPENTGRYAESLLRKALLFGVQRRPVEAADFARRFMRLPIARRRGSNKTREAGLIVWRLGWRNEPKQVLPAVKVLMESFSGRGGWYVRRAYLELACGDAIATRKSLISAGRMFAKQKPSKVPANIVAGVGKLAIPRARKAQAAALAQLRQWVEALERVRGPGEMSP